MLDETVNEVRLAAGTVRYRDSGSGEDGVIVFVHGMLTDGSLWDATVAHLRGRFRCVAPDLPLGSHRAAMAPDADLSPPGVAGILADFLVALDLRDVTVVGSDTGGAVAQFLAADHPERIGRLVLLPCDLFENFPPLMFRYLQVAAHVPGGIWLFVQSLRWPPFRHMPFTFGWLVSSPVSREIEDESLYPVIHDRDVRRDVIKLLRGIHRHDLLAVAERLRGFEQPTLVVYATEDRFFKLHHCQRLVAMMPDARLARIDGSRTFVSVDQPQRTAEVVASFAHPAK